MAHLIGEAWEQQSMPRSKERGMPEQLTPEQRAAEVRRQLWVEHGFAGCDGLEEAVAAAIRDAVAVEREACAALVEGHAGAPGSALPDGDDGSHQDGWNAASNAGAAAIRARTP